MVAENNNATCSICGNGYRKCLSCKDTMRLQPWKDVTDTAECYKVFQVVRGYSIGLYTKEEFKSKLKNIDLSNLENFRDHIKAMIKDALKEEPVVEDVEEIRVVEKPVSSRKRNNKVDDIAVME